MKSVQPHMTIKRKKLRADKAIAKRLRNVSARVVVRVSMRSHLPDYAWRFKKHRSQVRISHRIIMIIDRKASHRQADVSDATN